MNKSFLKKVITVFLTVISGLIILCFIFKCYQYFYISRILFIEYLYYAFGIIGSIGTVLAVIVATHIPQKIAKRQSDLLLFEKRYTLYQSLKKIIFFGNEIKKTTNNYIEITICRRDFMIWLNAMEVDFIKFPEMGVNCKWEFDSENNFWGYNFSSPNTSFDNCRKTVRFYIKKQCSNTSQEIYLLPKNLQKDFFELIKKYEKFILNVVSMANIERQISTEEYKSLNEFNIKENYDTLQKEFIEFIEISEKKLMRIEELLRFD